MHYEGAPSWRASETCSREVIAALYIRDVGGVMPPAALPRLDPPLAVAVHARTLKQQHALEQQWERWWASIVEPEAYSWRMPLAMVPMGSLSTALPSTGITDLTDLILAHGHAAADRAEAAATAHSEASMERMPRDGLTLTNLVAEHGRSLGRRVTAFDLHIEVLPLAEPGAWWIGERSVAIAQSVQEDPEAYALAMHPIIERLA